jgi:hypothetical protein
MRAFGVARAIAAAAIATVMACSIWAALDDPYKSDSSIRPPVDAGAFSPRVIDAGFSAYAIAAYGDNTYALEAHGQVYAAHDASTRFSTFWTPDGGSWPQSQKNGIAASAGGVFWTLGGEVRYCALDGGGCGSLMSSDSGAIAASDSVVAWIDTLGVRVCSVPVAGCNPTMLGASKSAVRLAAGPNGTVAWTAGGATIHLANGQASVTVIEPHSVAVLATDAVTQDLYWQGPDALGLLDFDGGSNTAPMVVFSGVAAQLFALGGVAYWSVANPSEVQACPFDSTGMACVPRDLPTPKVAGAVTFDGIVVNSRNVLALLHTDRFSELIAWKVPPL